MSDPMYVRMKGVRPEIEYEVVRRITRCKECVLWDPTIEEYCDKDGRHECMCVGLGIRTSADFFCAMGVER